VPGIKVLAPGTVQNAHEMLLAALAEPEKREVPYYVGTSIDLGTATAWLAARNAQRSVRERILPAVLLLKAAAVAARRIPEFNAYFENDAARRLEHVNLGVAIALRGSGLVAPAIHDADRLDVDALMTKLQDPVGRARSGTLRSSELSDGMITVTSLGERGIESVFPIIPRRDRRPSQRALSRPDRRTTPGARQAMNADDIRKSVYLTARL
jgi:pyruvate dehydrogenase E2 component (dihydrolipoamide acetyltransferase)